MPLCHQFIGDARFYDLLLRFDEDLAGQAREGGCPWCDGGRLDGASYPRKPRGGPRQLGPEHHRRHSLCCARCRRRATPPSVRFLGRKVYFAAVIVLVTAMLHGATPTRIARLREHFGVSWSTVDRWRKWWHEAFARSQFWQVAKARLALPVDVAKLPYSLLTRFSGNEEERLFRTLQLVSPVTTRSAAGVGAG